MRGNSEIFGFEWKQKDSELLSRLALEKVIHPSMSGEIHVPWNHNIWVFDQQQLVNGDTDSEIPVIPLVLIFNYLFFNYKSTQKTIWLIQVDFIRLTIEYTYYMLYKIVGWPNQIFRLFYPNILVDGIFGGFKRKIDLNQLSNTLLNQPKFVSFQQICMCI